MRVKKNRSKNYKLNTRDHTGSWRSTEIDTPISLNNKEGPHAKAKVGWKLSNQLATHMVEPQWQRSHTGSPPSRDGSAEEPLFLQNWKDQHYHKQQDPKTRSGMRKELLSGRNSQNTRVLVTPSGGVEQNPEALKVTPNKSTAQQKRGKTEEKGADHSGRQAIFRGVTHDQIVPVNKQYRSQFFKRNRNEGVVPSCPNTRQ